jgi:Ca-activated chloride channel homolog
MSMLRKVLFASLFTAGCLGAAGKSSRYPYLAASDSRAVVAAGPERPVMTPAVEAAPVANAEEYTHYGKNPWTLASEDRLSTFAADVDTASYTIGRRKLMQENALPPAAAVRVEEWVNYFKYSFPAPQPGSPFSTIMEAAPHPFASDRHVLRVGVATKAKTIGERKPSALVFLVDVSGSMASDDKLGLAKKALHILTENLTAKDAVSIVTYAGSSRVILPMTSIDHRDRIHAAIEKLSSGGSTAMASGIDLAYEQAAKWVRPNAISRVIVLSDGDANVGPHSHNEILDIINTRAKAGVTLSTIGFGMGNYKDTTMEQLADKGNGNAYYLDSLDAAKRVFSEQLTATLEVAAKDVKLQVEFDPAQVSRYRLLGYENRDVADNDFRKDAVDGGEMGWGHQVTAMYEVELTPAAKARPAPLGTVRIRHKQPDGDKATEAAFAMSAPPAKSLALASNDLRFAFAVAAFGDILRGGSDGSLDAVREHAVASAGDDKDRRELVALIDKARSLRGDSNKIATDPQAKADTKVAKDPTKVAK